MGAALCIPEWGMELFMIDDETSFEGVPDWWSRHRLVSFCDCDGKYVGCHLHVRPRPESYSDHTFHVRNTFNLPGSRIQLVYAKHAVVEWRRVQIERDNLKEISATCKFYSISQNASRSCDRNQTTIQAASILSNAIRSAGNRRWSYSQIFRSTSTGSASIIYQYKVWFRCRKMKKRYQSAQKIHKFREGQTSIVPLVSLWNEWSQNDEAHVVSPCENFHLKDVSCAFYERRTCLYDFSSVHPRIGQVRKRNLSAQKARVLATCDTTCRPRVQFWILPPFM